MKPKFTLHRAQLLTLVSTGLGLGLLVTALAWVFPAFAKALFSHAAWPGWTLTLVGAFLLLTGTRLNAQPRVPSAPRPGLLLAVLAATALVYLFPELFAPGCNGMPRAFAACPPACRVTTCTDWDAPGENGCNAKPPNKGCCVSYATTCEAGCSDPDPDPDPTPAPTPIPLLPPVVSGSVSCALPGVSGWCKNGAVLNLSASDPQGYATTLSGDLAGAAFSCPGPACSQTLPVGSGAIHFQASAPASGLSSALESVSFAFDPTPPTATLVISGTSGANGWYTAASASTTAADATSGIASTQVAVEGGLWQASASLDEGTHSVMGRAIDTAGNLTVTPAQVVKVDATAPLISAAVTSGTLVSGWYVTAVTLTASASDATSGLALTEYRLNGGSWSPGDSLTVAAEGLHHVDFRATDQAGLLSTTSLSFEIDKTPPAITFTPTGTPGTGGWYTSPVAFLVNAADALSGVASIETRLNGGSWVPGDSLILTEGVQTVEARATDHAGNLSAVSTIDIQVDTTAPSLDILLSGKLGLADWYVSEVTVSASVLEATSGIFLTETRLNGGSWQTGTELMVSADGLQTVDFRTTDQAGNVTTARRSFKLDATPPTSAFSQPLEGTPLKVTGTVQLSGASSDALSGLAGTEISLDGGETWRALPQVGGAWLYVWETLHVRDGLYTLLVQAEDQAGNREKTARVQIIVGNRPPKVEIQEAWWLWEAGVLTVQPRQIPIREVSLRISCAPYHPEVVLVYTGESFPAKLKWDRRCGDGTYAAESGNYSVTLTACDTFGHCAEDSGVIKVPLIALPVPTWTPTAEPTATPRATEILRPSPTVRPRVTALPTVVPSPKPVPATPRSQPAWLAWLLAILLAGLLALATAAILDPRPRALRRLMQTLDQLGRDGQA